MKIILIILMNTFIYIHGKTNDSDHWSKNKLKNANYLYLLFGKIEK